MPWDHDGRRISYAQSKALFRSDGIRAARDDLANLKDWDFTTLERATRVLRHYEEEDRREMLAEESHLHRLQIEKLELEIEELKRRRKNR